MRLCCGVDSGLQRSSSALILRQDVGHTGGRNVASLLLVAALATSLPTVDIKAICSSAQAAALPEERSRAFDSCVNEEQAAFNQLKQKWTQYSRVAHENCAEFRGMSLSYVELLTCLQMQSGGDLSANHLSKPSGGDLGADHPQQPSGPAPNMPNRLGADHPQPPPGPAPKMPKRLMSPNADP